MLVDFSRSPLQMARLVVFWHNFVRNQAIFFAFAL